MCSSDLCAGIHDLDDVVDSIRLAMDCPLKNGEIIQIVDTCTLNQNQVLKMVTGGKGGVIRVPLFVVYGLGKVSEIVLGLMKRKSPLSVYRLKSALAVREFRSKNAESLLGWEPKVGVCEGIKRDIAPLNATISD